MTDYDTPWKEALEMFLAWLLELLFPKAFAETDWSRGYDSLDMELQQIVRVGKLGRRLADKLFRVWTVDGREQLIHMEVEGRRPRPFGKRMYVYNYRAFDRFDCPVASFAILTDGGPRSRGSGFGYTFGESSLRLEFGLARVMDYAGEVEALEQNPSPAAVIVLAHVAARQTAGNADQRYEAKVKLVKSLFDRGYGADEFRQLHRMIDWLLDLPEPLEMQFQDEIYRFEKERQMPYLSKLERSAEARGEARGVKIGEALGAIELGLELKYGAEGLASMPEVSSIQDLEALQRLREAIRTAKSLDEFRTVLQKETA